MTTNTTEGRPQQHTRTGPEEELPTTLDPQGIAGRGHALPLLSAAMHSLAGTVVEVLTILTPEMIRPLDPPSATALSAVLAVAERGLDPIETLVVGELRRTGLFTDDHQGRLLRGRIEAAASPAVPGASFRWLAADLAADVEAAAIIAYAAALRESVFGHEDDRTAIRTRGEAHLDDLAEVRLRLRAGGAA
ncbi:MAG: hypothetical protein QM809_01090 [Gordonia sp. (in: high G+C Gram-positive bacteria)]|uniref:hypothetical protein n=1 Tax=Gordonia sp. (in: high G+C Gram-positive bacteria) TaxID=84139 RepID=UPI0039E2E065